MNKNQIIKELCKIHSLAAKGLENSDFLVTKSNGVMVASPYHDIMMKSSKLIIELFKMDKIKGD